MEGGERKRGKSKGGKFRVMCNLKIAFYISFFVAEHTDKIER